MNDHPECDFALIYSYNITHDSNSVSLRASENKQVDVSVIATHFGGGGHPKASGFGYKGNISTLFERQS